MQLYQRKIQIISLFLVVFCAFGGFNAHLAYAQTDNPAFSVTGLPLPRFVSLASDKIFMRTGPGQKYPLLWEYNRRNLPVEIVMEFDVWRKIRDMEGAEGWVHKSLLSGRRFVLVRAADEPVRVMRRPDETSRLMAYIESGAMAALDTCEGEWCAIKAQGYAGWVQRKSLWGVYGTEQFN